MSDGHWVRVFKRRISGETQGRIDSKWWWHSTSAKPKQFHSLPAVEKYADEHKLLMPPQSTPTQVACWMQGRVEVSIGPTGEPVEMAVAAGSAECTQSMANCQMEVSVGQTGELVEMELAAGSAECPESTANCSAKASTSMSCFCSVDNTFPRVVFYPFNQNDDAWNNGSHGRRGCFFHCAVAAADHLHGHWWGTDGSWCKSIFHRGTACADIWSQEVVPRETQELGLPSDGHVCLREAKHQVDNIDLGKFNAMMPIVQLLSTVDQCCQEFVGIDDVAKFIDGQCHDSSDGHRLAFMITLDGKWSVAVRSSTSLHLLHFDPHVADDAHLDQSLLAVLRDGADLVQIMMRRGAYFPESRGAVYCFRLPDGPCRDASMSCAWCSASEVYARTPTAHEETDSRISVGPEDGVSDEDASTNESDCAVAVSGPRWFNTNKCGQVKPEPHSSPDKPRSGMGPRWFNTKEGGQVKPEPFSSPDKPRSSTDVVRHDVCQVRAEPQSTPEKPRSSTEGVKRELSPITPPPVTKSRRIAPNPEKWLAQKAEQGKVVAKQAGLDYNKHFQVKHRGQFEAGHWREFLGSLAGAQVWHCECCAELCADFSLSCAAYNAGSAAVNDGGIVLISDDEPDPAPAAPRARGRPHRGDERLNLTEWISQKRPGQYHIHSLDGPIPVTCRLCRVTFNAQRLGSPWFIERHEQEDSRHRQAIDGLQPQKQDAVELQTCNGICIRDSAMRHMEVSSQKHIQNGQMATVKCAVQKMHFFNEQGHVKMQSVSCQQDRGIVPEGRTACRMCEALSRKQELVRSLASWVYKADLVGLMHMRLQGRDADATTMVANMQSSDWQQVLKMDLADLQTVSFKGLLNKCRQIFLSIPMHNRNKALQDWIDTRVAWVSPGHNPAVRVRTPEQRKMVLDFANCILSAGSGGERNPGRAQTSPQSMKLAKLVANGALSGQGVLEFLLSAAVEKADKVRRGCKRVNATGTMQCNQDTLFQVAWSLGQAVNQKAVREIFGVNLKAVKTDLRSEIVPTPYCAEQEVLIKNFKLAIGHLNAMNQQTYMIAVDETVYSKTWEVLYGLGEPWVLGGAHPDFAWLPLAEHRVPPPADKLADLCFSACVKDLVSRGPCWDCQMLPRRHKQTNATSHFRHMGDLLEACREANNGHGPLVLAHDAHMNHSKVTAFCMGIASTQLAAEAASHPFWQLCSFRSLTSLPFWPFRQLTYGANHLLFVTVDAGHVQKAIARAGGTHIRKIKLGSFFVDYASLHLGGMPQSSYSGRDWQSDVEAARVFNPGFLANLQRPSWDSIGIHLYQFLTACVTGASLSGKLWSEAPTTLLHNTFFAYYWLILNVSEAEKNASKRWDRIFVASQTCHNMLQQCAQVILRLMHWPEGVPFIPRAHQEECAELHFAKVKAPYAGAPCLRDAVLSTHQAHLKMAGASKWDSDTAKHPVITRVSPGEAAEIAKDALSTACSFQSALLVNRPAASLQAELRTWWERVGRTFVTSNDVPPDAVEVEDFSEWHPEEEGDVDSSHTAEVVRTLSSLEKLVTSNQMEQSALEHEVAHAKLDDVEAQEDDPDNTHPKHVRISVKHLLADAGLQNFNPPAKDSLDTCIPRVMNLLPFIQLFVAQVRKAEGWISPAQIDTPKHHLNEHNQMVSELAGARQCLVLSRQRVSRFQMWAGYSEKAASKACAEVAAHDGVSECKPLQPITSFRPSCLRVASDDGKSKRKYQLVVIRRSLLHQPMLAIIQAAYRGTVQKSEKGTKQLGSPKPVCWELPANCCVWLHAVILDRRSETRFIATSSNPVTGLDPLSDDLLCEVPASQFAVQERAGACVVDVQPSSLRAVEKLRQAKPSMPSAAKESPSATKAMYYTYDTFQNMKTRAKAIRDYLDVLREQYEKEHGELVRDGVICAEPCSQNLPWEQVVAQAPRFFELRHQGMKDPSRSSFGIFVLQEMHKCLMKSKGFPKLLSEISSSGILVLPGPALGP